MPDARCTRSRLCSKKAQASATTGTPHQPAFPAQWCYGLYVISPVTGLCCHRRPWFVSTNLAPASGRQDHTISPSAIASVVAQKLRLTLPRPSHPASNVRDDREAPLMWQRDGDHFRFDLGFSRSDLFLLRRLDRFSRMRRDLPVMQSHYGSRCERTTFANMRKRDARCFNAVIARSNATKQSRTT
jgi:hypothetical protein